MNRSLTNSSMHLVAVEAAGAEEKKGAEKKAQRKKKCCSRHEGKKGCREEAGDEEVGAGLPRMVCCHGLQTLVQRRAAAASRRQKISRNRSGGSDNHMSTSIIRLGFGDEREIRCVHRFSIIC